MSVRRNWVIFTKITVFEGEEFTENNNSNNNNNNNNNNSKFLFDGK